MLAPLGITLDGAPGTPGPDLGFLAKRGVPWVHLAQDATELFDHHHSANDTLDKLDRDPARFLFGNNNQGVPAK